MHIKLLKDTNGFITGFVSHIPTNKLWKHKKADLMEIPDRDYQTLFYYLVGRDKVREKKGTGSVKVAGLDLKDEGDYDENVNKFQKDIFKFKPNHILNS